ncbi:MAG: alpha/beta hydrolase [Brevinematia bacterium]
MEQFEEKIFKVDEDRFISYFDIGEGKKTLFLIHGWLNSKEVWIPIIKHLNLKKYRIIAIDMLGHGNSSRSLKLKFNTLENISILSKFILDLGLEKITLIGHSTGGKISLFLANRLHTLSKSIVKSVILVNSIGTYEFWRTLHPLLKVAFFRPIRTLIGLFILPPIVKFFFKRFLFFLPIEKELKENISKYLSYYTKIHFESTKNKICALRITENLFDRFVEDIDRSELPEVKVIYSQKDELVPIQAQYKFSILFKTPIVILPNSGHMVILELPKEVAQTLEKLLN